MTEIKVKKCGTIDDIDDDELVLKTDSQDTDFIKEYYDNDDAIMGFGGFFVGMEQSNYGTTYGFYGIIPTLDKAIYEISFVIRCRNCKKEMTIVDSMVGNGVCGRCVDKKVDELRGE